MLPVRTWTPLLAQRTASVVTLVPERVGIIYHAFVVIGIPLPNQPGVYLSLIMGFLTEAGVV